MYKEVIFREYDVRGVFEGDFDLDFAYQLGKGYVSYLNSLDLAPQNKNICIGYDARLSSIKIEEALIRGITDAGCSVLRLGLVTSPMCYFATFEVENVVGAIQITGSHNPPEYNGFKISVGKRTIFGEDIQTLRHHVDKSATVDAKGPKGKATVLDIKPKYIERYKNEFKDLTAKVVFDCGNGAAGSILRPLLEAIGLKADILFEEPDGLFPNHHPDPTVEKNLVDLSKAVLKQGAVCGIGFDGDADRIGLVDHTGRMLYGDELMVIVSRDILAKDKGAKIIGDVKCSDRLFADIEAHGGKPIMWKTGHSLIKEKIRVEGAPFGGEMSGHVFFKDRNYGYDDAIYAGLRIAEILSRSNKNLTQLMEGLPPSFSTPEIRIDTTEEKKHAIVAAIQKQFATRKDVQVNLIDGIRVSFPNGWALCRASNTQPVVVFRFESQSEEGLMQIKNEFDSIASKIL